MKKLLALILALTLALGTVACGNSAPANDGAAGVSGDTAVPAAEGMQETLIWFFGSAKTSPLISLPLRLPEICRLGL